ncbi:MULTISPECIES: hypothetical protein [unclassified Corallococcus]|uniref:hypothetical protein n=1 Tax=unclassified Corallococcus TaxID=2685029 RepID=UPI0018F2ED7F|nr:MULTISPECIES: hypothetical protein [unclassified Corallococcus]
MNEFEARAVFHARMPVFVAPAIGLFADQLGIDIGASTTAERTRAYVNAFFDQHLRGSGRSHCWPRPRRGTPNSSSATEHTKAARTS